MFQKSFVRDQCAPPLNTPIPAYEAVFRIAETVGVNSTGGTIVNLGARLLDWRSGKSKSNQDDAWEVFFRGRLQRIVAFEGDPAANRLDLHELYNKTGGRFFLTEDARDRCDYVPSYAHASTIAHELRTRSVPRQFLLLKVDIDSIELHVVAAILQHFEPLVIHAEAFYERWKEHPVEFAALQRTPQQEKQQAKAPGPRTTAYNVHSLFGCIGTTAAMWHSYAPRLGYEVQRRVAQTHSASGAGHARSSASNLAIAGASIQRAQCAPGEEPAPQPVPIVSQSLVLRAAPAEAAVACQGERLAAARCAPGDGEGLREP